MENTNKDNRRENRKPRKFNKDVKEFEERVVQINRISKARQMKFLMQSEKLLKQLRKTLREFHW